MEKTRFQISAISEKRWLQEIHRQKKFQHCRKKIKLQTIVHNFGRKERNYQTIRTKIDFFCLQTEKTKNANQISIFQKGKICNETQLLLAKNLILQKNDLVIKNVHLKVKEFITKIQIKFVFLLPLFFLLKQLSFVTFR